MKKLFLVGILLLVFSLSFVMAIEQTDLDQLNDTVGGDNGDLANVLSAFGILESARINVFDESTNTIYGVVIENSNVTSILPGQKVDNPNYTVNVSEVALNAISNATDPAKEAIAQFKQGNITVEAHGIVETIQLFLFNIYLFFQ